MLLFSLASDQKWSVQLLKSGNLLMTSISFISLVFKWNCIKEQLGCGLLGQVNHLWNIAAVILITLS